METRQQRTPFAPSFLHGHMPSIFFAFRLVYIPASILTSTGHGLPWLNTLLALVATFGMEQLTRRYASARKPGRQGSALAAQISFLVVGLLLLGLFPEEAPTGTILWAAIGAVWGDMWSSSTSSLGWRGRLAGGLLGLTGLVGPGSWLMAGLLALWGWQSVGWPRKS